MTRTVALATIEFLATSTASATASDGPVVVHSATDPLVPAPSSESWWDVPVAQASALETTQLARKKYDAHKAAQRLFL
jgi:3D-(3,5/4)-trihydroxycyclohexane-1,2-dione acylhydrolase (decyclizing)